MLNYRYQLTTIITALAIFSASTCNAYQRGTSSGHISKKHSGNEPYLSNNSGLHSDYKSKYRQNAGFDPAGWLLAGPALDSAASSLERPYNESYGAYYTHRNYIYYDWGW